jgi:tripeptide aminopeptidase
MLLCGSGMSGAITHSAFSRIGQLASLPRVHAAFQWFHLHDRRVMQWQQELVSIAAPPFGESRRAEWLAERFRELNLQQVEIDSVGNVLGCYPGSPARAGQRCVMLSAHIDTVFPLHTPIAPLLEHNRLEAPGACDNGAGVAGLLAVAAALENCGIELPGDLLFAGNVGEEGEGDLRGMRYLYGDSRWRKRIAANVVLDGAGSEVAVTQALGSRRFLVTMKGPGGHSWTDAGIPNPIVVLSQAIAALSEVALPASPRTTLNIGTMEGGSSVNSIPEFAAARFDLRSLEAEQLVRLEVELHRAVEDAVLLANASVRTSHPKGTGSISGRSNTANSGTSGNSPSSSEPLQFLIERIGDRPAGRLADNSPLLEALHAVDRHLGIRTEQRVASTDANIPLSLSIPALSIGAGGDGGGIHTRGEWYDSTGRELALKRIFLLLLLALDQVAPSSEAAGKA